MAGAIDFLHVGYS